MRSAGGWWAEHTCISESLGPLRARLLERAEERLRRRRVHEVEVDEVVDAQRLEHQHHVAWRPGVAGSGSGRARREREHVRGGETRSAARRPTAPWAPRQPASRDLQGASTFGPQQARARGSKQRGARARHRSATPCRAQHRGQARRKEPLVRRHGTSVYLGSSCAGRTRDGTQGAARPAPQAPRPRTARPPPRGGARRGWCAGSPGWCCRPARAGTTRRCTGGSTGRARCGRRARRAAARTPC